MALVNNQVSVVCNNIIDDAFPVQGLNSSEINDPSRTILPTADLAYQFGINIEKLRDTLLPLFQQRLSIHQD